MTGAELLRAELERRLRWRAVVEAAFEVTGDPHDRIRRSEVLYVVAKALNVKVIDNFFQRRVIALVESMGGEAIRPRNKRYYRKIRRRWASVAIRQDASER